MKQTKSSDLRLNIQMFGLRNHIRKSFVPFKNPEILNAVRESFSKAGITVTDLNIDVEDYRNWIARAAYPPECYAEEGYGRHVFSQKTLEHYVACKMLDIKNGDVYIDIASSLSPLPDILPRLYGCHAYRQDLSILK
ncbi:MAG: hypothetical protein ABSA18_03670 [Dehalococcoidia bacterium]